MNKYKITLYILTDCFGEKYWGVVRNFGDVLCLGGVDKNCTRQTFYDEAYKANQWAEKHGFEIKSVMKEIIL